jgi:hypothetical protein
MKRLRPMFKKLEGIFLEEIPAHESSKVILTSDGLHQFRKYFLRIRPRRGPLELRRDRR